MDDHLPGSVDFFCECSGREVQIHVLRKSKHARETKLANGSIVITERLDKCCNLFGVGDLRSNRVHVVQKIVPIPRHRLAPQVRAWLCCSDTSWKSISFACAEVSTGATRT